jgi:hypothetical protein
MKKLVVMFSIMVFVTAQAVSVCAEFTSLLSRNIIPANSTYTGQSFDLFASDTTTANIEVTAVSGGSYSLSFTATDAADYAGIAFNAGSMASLAVNASAYEFLSFQISGTPANIPIKIEIQTNSGSAGRKKASLYISDYLDAGIQSTMQQVTIPLAGFANLDDLSNVKSVVFVFEHDYAVASGYPTSGSVTISNLSFSTGQATAVRIDHFGDNWGWMAVGGNMGSMSANGTPTAHTISYDATTYHDHPRAMRVAYDLATDSWAGMFMLFGGGSFSTATSQDPQDGWYAMPCDFSDYRYLSLWVRAASETQNPELIKIEIKDDDTTQLSIYLQNITTEWQQYRFDLNAFSEINTARITQINFIYERIPINTVGGDRAGVVYFDDIEFQR